MESSSSSPSLPISSGHSRSNTTVSSDAIITAGSGASVDAGVGIDVDVDVNIGHTTGENPPANSEVSCDTTDGNAGDPDDDTVTVTCPDETAHLARFEISDAGSKILMVEWVPECVPISPMTTLTTPATATTPTTTTATTTTPIASGASLKTGVGHIIDKENLSTATQSATHASSAEPGWEVSWPGKLTFLPARDLVTPSEESAQSSLPSARRRIFFLLPPSAPVPTTVTITPAGRLPIKLKPLPAIFPPGFGPERGSRGVLHTIWAKRRLRELDVEMRAEMKANAESVGLEMVLAEKAWIEENFLKSPASPAVPVTAVASSVGMVPISPRSPVGGRLGEKLKGLRLGTSTKDLIPQANTFTAGNQSETLSPHRTDVAISSFAAMSLDAAVMSANTATRNNRVTSGDSEDDLFALPMSPRSPEMPKSPFSALS